MVDEAGAVWIPSPNYFENRNGYTPKWIIVHGTAGFNSARDVGTYFQTADVSANYVIGQDGTIVQCVAEKDGAWGNGVISTGHDPWWTSSVNPNWVTISIEHVKPHTDNSDVLTDAQKAASFRLISHICARHKIAPRRADANGGITGHYSIDPVNRSRCPGPYPWDELFSYLTNGGNGGNNGGDTGSGITLSDEVVARYFEQGGNGSWRCKVNGYSILGGILSFYCQFGNSAKNGLTYLGLPLMNEFYPDPGSPWSYQRFERGILAYDPNHHFDRPPGGGTVYLMHIDKPLPQGQGSGMSTNQQLPPVPASTPGQPMPVPANTPRQPAPSVPISTSVPVSGSGQPAPTDTSASEPDQQMPPVPANMPGAEQDSQDDQSNNPMPAPGSDQQGPVYPPYPQYPYPYPPYPPNQYPSNPYQYPPNPYRSGPPNPGFPSFNTPPPKSSLGEFISGAVEGGVTGIIKRILSRK